MENYLKLKYDATVKKIKEEHDEALRPHKALYESEEALINKATYIPGDTDGDALLKRIKQMRKPRQDNYERYQKATRDLVVVYDRKLNQAHRDYQRTLDEFRQEYYVKNGFLSSHTTTSQGNM